jgi:hypothetical protein
MIQSESVWLMIQPESIELMIQLDCEGLVIQSVRLAGVITKLHSQV